jgi:hypothetical protein
MHHSEDIYDVRGRSLLVRNWDDSVARVGRKFFEEFHLSPAADLGNRQAECIVNLRIGNPPSNLLEMQQSERPRGRLYTDGSRSLLAVGGSHVTVEPGTPSCVTVWFGDSEQAKRDVSMLNALCCAFPAALRKCGLFDVHAGAVTEPLDGTGFLLIGQSNSGKSSLTVRLASAGWKYLSDDMITIDDCETGVEAIALRRVFSVDPSSLSSGTLPSLNGALGDPVRSDPRKRRLEPSIAFPAGFVASCIPRVICFVQVAQTAASHVLNLSQTDAMRRLIHHCTWFNYDTAGAVQFLRILGRLVRQSKCIALNAGIDVYEQPALAAKLFRSAADA